jgi:probable rRNA maturation factor
VTVRLTVEGGPHRGVPRASLERAARAMLVAIRMADHELSVVLTGDAEIQHLNRVYRRKNKPTDVLAFSQREGLRGEQAGSLLGDVVVSVPTARRQAEALSRSVLDEVLWLVAHGILHLIGWDHETDAKDRRMRKETARLFEAAKSSASKGARALRQRTAKVREGHGF